MSFANFGRLIKSIDFKQLSSTASIWVGKHAPEIATAFGITGFIGGTVLAVKATKPAVEKIEYLTDKKGSDLTPSEVVKETWKLYLPAAITTVGAAACIVGANSVYFRRNAVLTAAYALSEQNLKALKNKVVSDFENNVTNDKVEDVLIRDPKTIQNSDQARILKTGHGESLIFDTVSGRYFYSDFDFIKKCINDLNHLLNCNSRVRLNDLYEMLNLPYVKYGDEIGWLLENGLIELLTDAKRCDLNYEGETCLVIDFIEGPYLNNMIYA